MCKCSVLQASPLTQHSLGKQWALRLSQAIFNTSLQCNILFKSKQYSSLTCLTESMHGSSLWMSTAPTSVLAFNVLKCTSTQRAVRSQALIAWWCHWAVEAIKDVLMKQRTVLKHLSSQALCHKACAVKLVWTLISMGTFKRTPMLRSLHRHWHSIQDSK